MGYWKHCPNCDEAFALQSTLNEHLTECAPRGKRIAYLEGELRRIAHGNWSSPPIDSESANTYAQIVNEMQNIAKLALTAIVSE